MPLYEVKWNAFGVYEFQAEDEDHVKELLDDELFGLDWDGLDYEIEEIDE